MKIFEFIDTYCGDLMAQVKREKELLDLSCYPYDEVLTDIDGNRKPAIYIDGKLIPIEEVLGMCREDFIETYKLPSAAESYDNYIDNLNLVEGEEAVSYLRIKLQQEMERVIRENQNGVMLEADF